MRVARGPSRTASVRLPATRSVPMSRRLFTTRIAVTSIATGSAGDHGRQTDAAGVQVGRADHGHEPEEEEDGQIAEPVVGERPRPAGVEHAGRDRQHPDDEDRPAADER